MDGKELEADILGKCSPNWGNISPKYGALTPSRCPRPIQRMHFWGLKTAQNHPKGPIMAVFFMPHTNQKRWPRLLFYFLIPFPNAIQKLEKIQAHMHFPKKKILPI